MAAARHEAFLQAKLPLESDRSTTQPTALALAQIGPPQLKRLEKLKEWKVAEPDLADFMKENKDFKDFDAWSARVG